MNMPALKPADLDRLSASFGDRLQGDAALERYTAARVGGPADALLIVNSSAELAEAVRLLWDLQIPFLLLGGGSNVLVSDAGVRGVVLLNRARQVHFDAQADQPVVFAESGANFGLLARQAAKLGLSGLEWAGGIPGTVGGAVFGNAGAHDGDIAHNLVVAEILHPSGVEQWPVERLGYEYRSSSLKKNPGQAVILSAALRLEASTPATVQAKMDRFTERRRLTQPPGASMGSMFKNPPGDFAGRLIEAAGLKGARVGGAEISPLHANFFINQGSATAADVLGLIELARKTVAAKSGVQLELEIELVGDWNAETK